MGDWPSGERNYSVRAYNSTGTFSLATNTYQCVPLNAERYRSIPLMHSTSATAVALTGTVQKTSGNATLAGTGSAFRTELVVGDQIVVPGTANETKYVTAIASDTSLTVNSNFSNSASGQTATVDQTPRIVIPYPGVYVCTFNWRWPLNGTGQRETDIVAHSGTSETIIALNNENGSASAGVLARGLATQWKFAAGDFVVARPWHSSGGNLVLDTAGSYSPELAVTYLCKG